MLDYLSAFKWYPVFLIGTALIAQAQAIDYKDLISGAPAAGAVILVVFAMLRRLDPLTKAVNKNASATKENTAVLMEVRNAIGRDGRYSQTEIIHARVSAKDPSDD